MSNLKPCPLCGGDVSYLIQNRMFRVQCKNCGARMDRFAPIHRERVKNRMKEDWNNRVESLPPTLKPCPICGGYPMVRKGLIMCHKCCFEVREPNEVEKWNTRVE